MQCCDSTLFGTLECICSGYDSVWLVPMFTGRFSMLLPHEYPSHCGQCGWNEHSFTARFYTFYSEHVIFLLPGIQFGISGSLDGDPLVIWIISLNLWCDGNIFDYCWESIGYFPQIVPLSTMFKKLYIIPYQWDYFTSVNSDLLLNLQSLAIFLHASGFLWS